MKNNNEYVRLLCSNKCKGYVDINISKVVLEIHHHDPKRSHCRFQCPDCETKVVLLLEDSDIEFLIEKGVTAKHYVKIYCNKCSSVEMLEASGAKVYIDHSDLEKSYILYKCFNWGYVTRIKLEIGEITSWRKYNSEILHINKKEDPPITHDDILNIHYLLEEDDWFDKLIEITEYPFKDH